MTRNKAIALLVLTGALWSTGGFIIKMIPWHPLAIAGLRSGFAGILVLFYSKPGKYAFNIYTWIGAVFYVLMVVCFVVANTMTNAGNVILIQFAAPIYVAIFGFSFLGEKSTRIDWLAIIIILIGLGCFFLDDLSFDQLWGNLLALFSGFGFAGLTLIMRKQKHGNPIESVLLGNLMTFLVCAPFYEGGATLDLEPWAMIIFLGIVQLGLAYTFFSIAIKYVSALDAIIYPVIEPIFNPILAFLFLGEFMGLTSLSGGFLVLFGVIGRAIIQNNSVK